ncbi:Gam-like end protection [Rhodobacteraceae phage LS06-2018-MD05]|nr:Gam-like end protection [Rhodobacteraceae phage LS06-2018-MD05]
MKPIYEISKNYLDLIDQIEENNGEITPEIETSLAINEGEIKQKSVAYVAVMKSLESEVDFIDNEIKRLQALKKSRANIVQNLKDSLEYALNTFGIDEIKTELIKINFRKSKSVIIDKPELVPDHYNTITVTRTPNKKAIKEAIESGKKVKGAYISENRNLQIK